MGRRTSDNGRGARAHVLALKLPIVSAAAYFLQKGISVKGVFGRLPEYLYRLGNPSGINTTTNQNGSSLVYGR